MQLKRRLPVFFLLIVLTALLISACSGEKEKPKLSDLGDDELIQYITDAGVTIPEIVRIGTIRGMLGELEEDPEHRAPVLGYTPITDLYEDIRALVIEYNNRNG